MLAFLLSTIRRYLIAGVLALSIGFAGAWRWQGGRLDTLRSEYAAFKAEVIAAQKVHAAEDTRRDAQTAQQIKAKEEVYAKDIITITGDWTAYVERVRLRASADSANSGAKPALRFASQFCDDAARDQLVSATIQKYRDDLRTAVGDYRRTVAADLEQCEKQAARLISLQTQIVEIERVNR